MVWLDSSVARELVCLTNFEIYCIILRAELEGRSMSSAVENPTLRANLEDRRTRIVLSWRDGARGWHVWQACGVLGPARRHVAFQRKSKPIDTYLMNALALNKSGAINCLRLVERCVLVLVSAKT